MNLIAYDLVSPNDRSSDYSLVIGGIKRLYPSHVHIEKSIWVVKTNDTAEECYNKISGLFQSTDRWMVVRMDNWKAHRGFQIKRTLGLD